MRLKPYKSHRRDVSPFPFSFQSFGSVSHNPIQWFGSKSFVIGITLLIVTLGGVFLSQGPLFHAYASSACIPTPQEIHSGTPCGDPSTLIWRATAPNGDLSEFKTTGATYAAACLTGVNCVSLLPTVTKTAVALTNSTIGDLGLASGKLLAFHPSWLFSGAGGATWANGNSWGWYLTTNKTLPTQNSYDPATDPSVVLQVKIACNVNPSCDPTISKNYLTYAYALRVLGKQDTINSERVGNTCAGFVSSVNGTATSCYDSSQNALVPSGNAIASALYLNYTGATNGSTNCAVSGGVLTGPTCSWVIDSPETSSVHGQGVQDLPFFSFTASQYYLGLYAFFGNTAATQFTFDTYPGNVKGNMDVFVFVPTPSCNGTTANVCPNIDTGGFFGPVIKALIIIGVFILQNVINFGTYLAAIFWPLFTAIANGLWALLQTLASSLSAVIVAILNVFEAIVKSLLNTIGQTFGFPASSNCNFVSNPGGCGLGDDLFQDITYLISAVTSSIATFIGGVGNIFTAVLNFFTAITTWFTTWGVYFLNAILALVNVAGEVITIVKNLLLYAPSTFTWGAIVLFIVYSSLDGLQGWFSWFETMGWLLMFGVSAAEKILNWLISTAVWVISQIPAFNFQADAATFGGGGGGKYMVGFDLPRLPLLEHNFRPSFPDNFTDPEIARFNLFSILGLVVGTFMLIYAVGANLVPGVSAANGVNLNLINALLPIGLVMFGALGAVMLPFLLGFLFRNLFGIKISTPSVGLGLSTEKIPLTTGKLKGPSFKVGVQASKHKFQARVGEDGKKVTGLRNIIREGKRQAQASQERLRRETEQLRERQQKEIERRKELAQQQIERERRKELAEQQIQRERKVEQRTPLRGGAS